MLTQARHLIHQRRMIASLGNAAAGVLCQRFVQHRRGAFPVPGPEVCARVPAPTNALIDDFVLHLSGDCSLYEGVIPPALFPQWGLPVALRALAGSGFQLVKILNGGCRLEVNAPLRRGLGLTVQARLASVSGDQRRTVLRQRIVTEQESARDALVADVYGIIRSPTRSGPAPSAKRYEPVSASASKLDEWRLGRDAGLSFALLTGDLNPLHWLPPYARIMGFRGAVLHGFAAMAWAYLGLERALWPRRLRLLDVRFVRPILLPATVSLYIEGGRVFVGAVGDAPYLSGSFALA